MVQRLTISLDDEIAGALDAHMARRGASNRSEAIRDLIREALMAEHADAPGACVAAVSYVYDHHERHLAARLTHRHHDHHDLAVSTMHAHLDHHHCLEVMILKGPRAAVRRLADETLSERGVHFGHVNLIPLKPGDDDHGHDHGGGAHVHHRPGV